MRARSEAAYAILIVILMRSVLCEGLEVKLTELTVSTVLNTTFIEGRSVYSIRSAPNDKLLILSENANSNYNFVTLNKAQNGSLAISTNNQIQTDSSFIDSAVWDDNQVLLTQPSFHCLYRLNIERGSVSVFAGSCDQNGYDDGDRLTEAYFDEPWGILRLKQTIYIADSGNNAIRTLETSNSNVETLVQLGVLNEPRYIAVQGTSDPTLYVTGGSGVVKLNILTKKATLLYTIPPRDSIKAYLVGITVVPPDIILMVDRGIQNVFIIDITQNNVTSVCLSPGQSIQAIDGGRDICHFKSPWSIHVWDDQVLVGELGAIRAIPLSSISDGTTTQPTATNGNTLLCLIVSVLIRF